MLKRAKIPEIKPNRFKAIIYGNRGSGKTHFCCSIPNSLYIDTEGVDDYTHFIDMIRKNNSQLIRLNDISDIIKVINELMSTKHEYKTVIIDSITFPVHLLSNLEADRLHKETGKEGTSYGANLAKAKRLTFELGMMLSRLDMNCIVVAHEKTKYEKNQEVGKTSDVNEKMEYALGTVLNIRRFGEKTIKVFVEKSRYPELKTMELIDFENGYEVIREKLGKNVFDREVVIEELATPEQIAEFKRLKELTNMSDELEQKYIINAGATTLEQMSKIMMQKSIDHLIKKVTGESK